MVGYSYSNISPEFVHQLRFGRDYNNQGCYLNKISCIADAGVQCSSLLPTAPPPSYREVEEKGGPPRQLQEDAPPGYDAVMAEQAEANATGPILRKKSLTNNAV